MRCIGSFHCNPFNLFYFSCPGLCCILGVDFGYVFQFIKASMGSNLLFNISICRAFSFIIIHFGRIYLVALKI